VTEIVVGCRNVWATVIHLNDHDKGSNWVKNFITVATYVQSIAGVALPVIAVAILNVSLIYFLKRREIIPRAHNQGSGDHQELRSSSDFATFQRQERKVTHAVSLFQWVP